MAEITKNEQKNRTDIPTSYTPPVGSSVNLKMVMNKKEKSYSASADWLILRKDKKPKAEMFYISYATSSENPDRPITFVFNGGPGASSVYLHLGAFGPQKVIFAPNGTITPPPYKLENNDDTWLQFTDLVFIDPIGTGFSSTIDDPEKKDSPTEKEESGKARSEYWKVKRDLESLGEFISSYLSKYNRWESPIYIAGESYGGYRTAKLTKMLQNDFGVGLSGAVIISPALEFSLLDGSDYTVLNWIDSFPVMAAAAKLHKKSSKTNDDETLEAYMKRAEEFAVKQLLPILATGDMFGESKRNQILNLAADYIGLPRKVVQAKNGRIEIDYFVKNLLREEGNHLGLYDVSLKVTDPYPDRDSYSGPDPTLHQAERIFAAGINTQLRKNIGLQTERSYKLLSMEVNKKWEVDTKEHALDSQVGATDDLRFGMSLNPDMKVFLTHGLFDLVTAYFAAERITRLMKLTDKQKEKLTVQHYKGGHMFYIREESRKQLFEDIRKWYKD
jgi:carboxypeptidase C (cathepsin A)